MFPDSKWLDALKLPLKATIAVALATAVLLALTLLGLLDLGLFGASAKTVLIILCVGSSVLAVVGIIDYLASPLYEKHRQSALAVRRAVRRQEEEEQREERQRQIISRLDHLSRDEIRYVADSLRDGTPTFYTYVQCPAVGMLLSKGLVWTTGELHHREQYPFSFNDFVWQELLQRKDEFLAIEDEHNQAEEAARVAQLQRRGY